MSLTDFLQLNPGWFLTTVFILGLLVGSFLNVVISRLPLMLQREWHAQCQEILELEDSSEKPERLDLSRPRSHCPLCGHMITALENIPVISYLFLRGRCSGCRKPISIRYPIIELLTATLMLMVAWHYGYSYQTALALVLTCYLIALTFIDADHQLLPDVMVLPLLWLGILANLNDLYTNLESSIIGAVAGYLVLWILFQIHHRLTGKIGMGYGDFKLLAVIGAWGGWQILPVTLILSSLVGAAVGISLIIFRSRDRDTRIPFGPYLAAAGWISLLWGDDLTRLYLNWSGLNP
ncbi:MAG TPA: prepilin peptidase [Gammaproteobacteria bacterium]|nr:prepilin peptidase [Gammaproteobacteria bacterium]